MERILRARMGPRPLWLALPACLALACSSATPASSNGGTTIDPANAASCQTPGRTGQVVCTEWLSCSAGTYCRTDPKDGFTTCQTGCTSDQNCGSSERCEKCGKSVGSCVNCATAAADACKSPVAPPPDDAGLPPGQCERSNFEDHWCEEAGRSKAYKCDDDAEPAKELNCAHPAVGPSWVYCCAK